MQVTLLLLLSPPYGMNCFVVVVATTCYVLCCSMVFFIVWSWLIAICSADHYHHHKNGAIKINFNYFLYGMTNFTITNNNWNKDGVRFKIDFLYIVAIKRKCSKRLQIQQEQKLPDLL